ncbi:cupin domain-containing protein [Anaerobacillus sp. 1_MG-2023]|uniref:cupin domain-containing protein n=1 Tax=Bacillales TaxID=1385 RepID=UPI0026E270E2|nr:cupin domain-containing protein [Anaerobacillus sp. 1_MG-2023]MDO6658491.1 cupin domain-containing protein [Anaerobacillus sp. 1_MG-2023]
MEKHQIKTITFEDDGNIPNNPFHPLILYPGALDHPDNCMKIFKENNWTNAWENGVFSYHHYHSNSHEVLGVIKGEASITFGGENGKTVEVTVGDVVVIPAGVGHKKEASSTDFRVVGAYPAGMPHDLRTGKADERKDAIDNIKNVPLPATDPIFGVNGPLLDVWGR